MTAKSRRRTNTNSTVHLEEAKSKRRRPKVDVMPDQFVGGFVGFLREHAVVGLAIGFVIGLQAQTLVKQLVSSFIDPSFKLLFGEALAKRDFAFTFHGRTADFPWGAFAHGLLNFLFVLGAIYLIVKLLSLDKLDKPKDK